MKKTILTVLSFAFMIASCTSQKAVKHVTNGGNANLYNKDRLKTGFWTERDTITAASLGIVNPDAAADNNYYRDTAGHRHVIPPKQGSDAIRWGNTSPYEIRASGTYDKGRKNGEWKTYLFDSMLVKREFYSDNALDSMFLYSSKGKLILEGRADWKSDMFVYKKYGYDANSGSFPLYFLSSNKNWNWIFE